MWTGNPVANSYPGTLLNWVNCNEGGNGTDAFSLRHGGNVATATKHLISMAMTLNSVQTVPAHFLLVDLQGYVKVPLYTASAQTLTLAPTIRYTNGVGCRIYIVQNTAGSGATTSFTLSYKNQSNVTTAVPGGATFGSVTTTGVIGHTGNANLRQVPFLALANGDTGVQNITNFQVTGATVAGAEGAICIARPIASISFTQSGTMYVRDFLTQGYSLPRVLDDACLTLLYQNMGAPTTSHALQGELEVAWG